MDQDIRNKLRNVVTQCRKLLEDSISQELEGKYGIFAKKDRVTADPNAEMSHLIEEDQAARRDILDHFAHIKARGFGAKDALDQLIREIAFTHLNRLCAYKMMEAREVYVGGQKFREAVSRGVNSNGVKFYLAEHPDEERLFNTGHQDVAYRHFLDWLGGALSEEIGVLFNPNDPANRLYPRQKTLDEVLELLNGGGIKPEETELREQWPLIWSQDETIGWVYQYFTPKELRDQARKESKAPRNSYELAFRNQFFTPRYIVECLTDNTLGRIWYEMRKGNTKLKDQCRYMVRRPTEIFLNEGEQPPKNAVEGKDDLSQEELLKLPVHIPHRPKKDPRELKILDPACGSGHFLLYCFDLLLTIYEEAYADPDIGPILQKDYPKLEDLQRNVPRLILAHNVHGIDIDLRASQIAALALWLRCQRAYQDMGLKKDRPKITRSNFVCAEPMPGEEQMLKEFVSQIEPKVLGQVVEVVFDKMKLAGEAGSLLKIEEEIRDAVAAAKKQYVRETTHATDKKGRTLLFTEAQLDRLSDKPQQASLFDVSDITDDQFFEQAEAMVIHALRSYAETAQHGQRLQRRLFTDDAVRGFAFVDLCYKRYDVTLMNPPFGEFSKATKALCEQQYVRSKHDVLAAFIEQGLHRLDSLGLLGAITSRTVFFLTSFETWRVETVLQQSSPTLFADLGAGVLDTAMVETAAFCLSKAISHNPTPFSRLSTTPDKSSLLLKVVSDLNANIHNPACYCLYPSSFAVVPGSPFAYWVPNTIRRLFRNVPAFGSEDRTARVTNPTYNDFRYVRTWWEPLPDPLRWKPWVKGGELSAWYLDVDLVIDWDSETPTYNGYTGSTHRPDVRPANLKYFFRPGLTYPLRASRFAPRVLPSGCLFSVRGYAIFGDNEDLLYMLGLLNSAPFDYLFKIMLGRFNYPEFIVGKIQHVPFPEPTTFQRRCVSDIAAECHILKKSFDLFNETSHAFVSPACVFGSPSSSLDEASRNWSERRSHAMQRLKELECRLDKVAFDVFNLDEDAQSVIRSNYEHIPLGHDETDDLDEECIDDGHEPVYERNDMAGDLVSWTVGVVYGRWRVAAESSSHSVKWQELSTSIFEPLGMTSPGMTVALSGENGQDAENPFSKQGVDGLLCDDDGNLDDIVRGCRGVVEVVWKDQADAINKEACEILGVKELRDYFRKPGKGGFWDDHISRYSKSRRKAPIYWLLQSSKKNYAIWLYYHRLDKDLLFKALVNYVEPKIRLETSRLETLRIESAAAGDSGKEAKRIAKEAEKQEDFLSELRDFEDKMRRAANLHLEPDLNDGVVLNIAPLHELVPWKEAKKYWNELMEGKYDWSSIGKQLREKGLVK